MKRKFKIGDAVTLLDYDWLPWDKKGLPFHVTGLRGDDGEPFVVLSSTPGGPIDVVTEEHNVVFPGHVWVPFWVGDVVEVVEGTKLTQGLVGRQGAVRSVYGPFVDVSFAGLSGLRRLTMHDLKMVNRSSRPAAPAPRPAPQRLFSDTCACGQPTADHAGDGPRCKLVPVDHTTSIKTEHLREFVEAWGSVTLADLDFMPEGLWEPIMHFYTRAKKALA